MSSKSIHCTSNKKFSDFMQLSNQHQFRSKFVKHHILHHFGIGSLQINFVLLKQTVICVTKTAGNVHFGNMKFTWRKMNSCSRCIFYLFLGIKKTACYLCDMLSNIFKSQIFSQ